MRTLLLLLLTLALTAPAEARHRRRHLATAAPVPSMTPEPAPPPAAPVPSRAAIFDQAAPATVLLLGLRPDLSPGGVGVGAILDGPGGLVVASYQAVLALGHRGTLRAVLYDPNRPAPEPAHAAYSSALPLTLLRASRRHDLALLELPHRSTPYASLEPQDRVELRVGQELLAVHRGKGLPFALASLMVSALREERLVTEPALPGGGAPLLDRRGRLLAFATAEAAAPARILRGFLAGQPLPGDDGLPRLGASALVDQVLTGLVGRLRPTLGARAALELLAQLHSALSRGGLQALRMPVSGEALQQHLAALAREGLVAPQALARLVSEQFPRLLIDSEGALLRRSGALYQRVPLGPAQLAAVDDRSGALYATDAQGGLIYFDEDTAQWRPGGLRDLVAMEASGGTLWALLRDGRLMAFTPSLPGDKARQAFGALVPGARLHAAGGALYLLRAAPHDPQLFDVLRYAGGRWDEAPLAREVRKLVAGADRWYALDPDNHLRSDKRPIDRDGDVVDLWVLGRDLLCLTRDQRLYLLDDGISEWRELIP